MGDGFVGRTSSPPTTQIGLSVIVLTLNEAHHLRACLDSVRGFADELIVFDSFSRDGTPELARDAGATVYQRAFENYPTQRNAALEAARGDWVFFIDADERADENVGAEICATIAAAKTDPDAPVLYWIPRRNFIFGKWIQHTGWSPDFQPRLLRKGKARFDPTRWVHELVICEGNEGYLSEPLLHFNYDNLRQFRQKQRAYTRVEAQVLFQQGSRPRWRGWIGQPAREFVRRYVLLEGYKDGARGLVLSALMAYYALVRHHMLAELWRTRKQ